MSLHKVTEIHCNAAVDKVREPQIPASMNWLLLLSELYMPNGDGDIDDDVCDDGDDGNRNMLGKQSVRRCVWVRVQAIFVECNAEMTPETTPKGHKCK